MVRPAPGGGGVSGAEIVQEAGKFEGDPYVYGAAGPSSFDCSGLVQYSLKQLGIQAPRTSEDQYAWTSRVSQRDVGAGDLIFFAGSDGTAASPGHVGIVVDPAKKTMIDALETGTNVQVQPWSAAGTPVGFGKVPKVSAPAGSSAGAGGSAGGGGLSGTSKSVLGGFLGEVFPGAQLGLDGLSSLDGLSLAVTGIAKEFEPAQKLLTWITLPSNWTRIFCGVFGAALLGAGVYFVMQEAGHG